MIPKISFKKFLDTIKLPKASEQGLKAHLYIKGITEETGNLNRLIRCIDYDLGFQMSDGISPKPTFTTMTITKPADKHSPTLALTALTNLTVPTMTLYFYNTKAAKVQYMIIMNHISILSNKQHMDPGGKDLLETVSFSFSKIEWNYENSSAGWDLIKNRPVK